MVSARVNGFIAVDLWLKSSFLSLWNCMRSFAFGQSAITCAIVFYLKNTIWMPSCETNFRCRQSLTGKFGWTLGETWSTGLCLDGKSLAFFPSGDLEPLTWFCARVIFGPTRVIPLACTHDGTTMCGKKPPGYKKTSLTKFGKKFSQTSTYMYQTLPEGIFPMRYFSIKCV